MLVPLMQMTKQNPTSTRGLWERGISSSFSNLPAFPVATTGDRPASWRLSSAGGRLKWRGFQSRHPAASWQRQKKGGGEAPLPLLWLGTHLRTFSSLRYLGMSILPISSLDDNKDWTAYIRTHNEGEGDC